MASSMRASMSKVFSSTSASLLSFSLRFSTSPGSTSPRCLLSRTRSLTFGTYPMAFTPIFSAWGAIVLNTRSDILLKMTPLMLFSLNLRNPWRTGSTERLAPRQSIRSTTGVSVFIETS